jgi:hypothetical protein
MYGAPGGSRPKPPSQGTAETLILVAFILQVIFSLVFILLGLFLLGVGGVFFLIGGFALVALAAVAIVVPILMIYVGYQYSYRRTRDGDFAGARGPTLLLGIMGLIVGGLVVGILYIIAYVKLSDAESESRSTGGWSGPGGMPNPYGAPYGTPYGTPYGGPGPTYGYGRPGAPPAAGGVAYAPPPSVPVASMCPRCGRPATYIPQYGRSYCYSCTQYV